MKSNQGVLSSTALALLLLSTAGYGSPFPAETELSALLVENGGDGSAGFVMNGINAYDETGSSVGFAGDVNGDGIDDLIVGTVEASLPADTVYHRGESYVLFGRPGGFPAEFELSTLFFENGGDGSSGFVLVGPEPGDAAGDNVGAAGDLNADGIDDIVVLGRGPDRAGRAYVVFGKNEPFTATFHLASLLASNSGNGTAGFVINGEEPYDAMAAAIAAGDFNSDGIDDLAIAACRAGPDGAGAGYVIFGSRARFPAEIDLSGLRAANGGDGSRGIVLNGVRPGDALCNASAAGDVNGDGIGDIIFGAIDADPNWINRAGQSYVIFGSDEAFPAEFQLSGLLPVNGGDGSAGFVLNGIQESGRASEVRGLGDINNDGFDDVMIGAWDVFANGATSSGVSYAVFGTDQGFAAEMNLSSLLEINGGDGSQGFVISGSDFWEDLGIQVSGGADMNGDGIADFMVDGESTYIFYGRDSGFPAEFEASNLLAANGGDGSLGFAVNNVYIGDNLGAKMGMGGDFNADGIDDLIFGTRWADPGGRPNAGASYVVYGRIADIDGDNVADATDNCTLVANPDQTDANGDGFGNACDADISGPQNADDCLVNFRDLATMGELFFTTPFSPNWKPEADLTGPLGNPDGIVNFLDLAVMEAQFFLSPGPSGLADCQ